MWENRGFVSVFRKRAKAKGQLLPTWVGKSQGVYESFKHFGRCAFYTYRAVFGLAQKVGPPPKKVRLGLKPSFGQTDLNKVYTKKM